ncbi:hypothetical protein [Streptomyces rugosispiralis]|uniref:Uncharacterized protein n=1 Tax=Streptomyces rugosispiralis TaxID=2967341 RepID=A0ABT1V3B9_9ACTN|nr:hypothetical protein [Streptomyces rugosispiralis]MCQ8191309.1 hypothetical protein [Streptomyces rugosispiralis]
MTSGDGERLQVPSGPRFTRLPNAADAARVPDSESDGMSDAKPVTTGRALPVAGPEGLAVGGPCCLPVRW